MSEEIKETNSSSLADMDIVYFVKEAAMNEELRYSLRSVAKNFPHRKVWLYGGKPDWCTPDEYVNAKQGDGNKWDKVRRMLRLACINPDITEDFVLFNDDFFVMKPVSNMPYYYRYSVFEHIVRLEMKYDNKPTPYSMRLKESIAALDPFCEEINSYELHIPMVLNRRKVLEVLGGFPNVHCTRTLYGNYQNVGGEKHVDVKVFDPAADFDHESTFLSTDDGVFEKGKVGEFIREKFPEVCKFETASKALKTDEKGAENVK